MLLNNDSQGFRRAQFGVVPVRSLLIGMKCPGCSEWLDMRDQVKFPPGFKLRPHWHPEAVRTVVILSGALYYANGEQWDESKLKPLLIANWRACTANRDNTMTLKLTLGLPILLLQQTHLS
jgi:hypothetical protein